MSLVISQATLKAFASKCDTAALAPALEAARNANAIDNARRLTHFMGQIYQESLGLTHLVENLDYSVERLMQVWPKRFPTAASATPYAHNPPALANNVYGNRLGNTAPDDGWRYRGRGLIQLTGKSNYTDAAGWSGLDLVANPDLAAQPAGAAQIAAAFWVHKGLNPIADQTDETAAIRQETKLINGGTLGLPERTAAIHRAAQIWS
jgi:putative chitinase